jgi:hypothetical protein
VTTKRTTTTEQWSELSFDELLNEALGMSDALDAARAAAEQAAKERDEARARYEDFRAAYTSEREQIADEEARIAERERDEARALLRDALYTRDRLAVEVQALREALRECIAHATQEKPEGTAPPRNRLQNIVCLAEAALSAPSESERVLRERDEAAVEKYRASLAVVSYTQDHFIKRVNEAKAEARAAALEEAARMFEAASGISLSSVFAEDVARMVRALAATPPSAASGITKAAELPREATGPARHILKTWPEPYAAMVEGWKTHEFRKDDRGYEVGDMLVLQEWRPDAGKVGGGKYTGGEIIRWVTYIGRGPGFGIPKGYCVMSVATSPTCAASGKCATCGGSGGVPRPDDRRGRGCSVPDVRRHRSRSQAGLDRPQLGAAPDVRRERAAMRGLRRLRPRRPHVRLARLHAERRERGG